MRHLSLLVVGLVLTWLGVRVVGGAELFAGYLLRDALLLGGLGSLIFALNAQGWRPPHVFRRLRGLPRAGQTLLLTGLIVAICGGLGLGLGLAGVAGLMAAAAWLLGMALQVAGAWWPGAPVEYAPPQVRWGKDAAGNFVALPAAGLDIAAGQERPRAVDTAMGRRQWLVWLCVLLALAALLRFWDLGQLPPGCVNEECAAALRLAAANEPAQSEPGSVQGDSSAGALPEGGDNPPALHAWLAGFFLRLTGVGVLSLRLSAALLGWLTVAALAIGLRRLVAPAPALLGAALLAISPWHLWAGRSSDPWIAAALLTTLALWLGLEALARAHARWWVLWGLVAGLLAAQSPALWPGAVMWILVVTSLGLVQALARAGTRSAWPWPLAGLAAAVSAALPAMALGSGWSPGLPAGEALANNAATLFGELLRADASAVDPFVQSGLLDGFCVALALAGCGVLLRHLRQPAAGLLLAGVAGLMWSAAQADLTVILPASVLLAVLPLLIALATMALDRLLAALVQAWGPPLVRTARLLAAAAVVLLLLAGRSTVALLWDLDAAQNVGAEQVETGMARFIAEWLGDHPNDATTFVVPRAVLDHASVRLLAGAALADGRLQALEVGRTLPYAAQPSGDVVYLQPVLENQVLELLRQLYPAGEAATEWDTGGERALFNRFVVREADLLRAQAIQMAVAPADPAAAAEGAAEPALVQMLDFGWDAAPPHPLPFTAEWNGSLAVPQSGNYHLSVASTGPESTFTLTLDDILVLDSSLGVRERQQTLAQGIYELKMSYRSGNQPGDLGVYWRPPGDEEQILGGSVLHFPTLANQGLLGDYYANDRFEGNIVAMYKDPVVGLDPGLAQPYSVRWHGQLAAPRAGEYLLGADAGGFVQLAVDGQMLADNRTAAAMQDDAAESASSYSEGLIYLSTGWHPIEVRYAPDQQAGANGAPSGLRLLWQPPGSEPGELASRNLLPAYGEVGPSDVALPPAPMLVDPMLGDEHFALSRASEVWQPHLRLPPAGLPPLPLESLWRAGGVCGSAADQFDNPHGVAFSPDGSKLFVADSANRRVKVYSVDGALEGMIVDELLQEPVDVAMPADGALLILDALAQQVYRLKPGDELTALPLQSSFYRPRGLAVDDLGNVLVADTGGARVVLIEPGGILAGQFGGQGSPLGRGQPVDVLATPNALWAISAEDGRLWNLTVDGSLTAVQPTGTVDGPHLAQLADGRLLASDPIRSTFTLFSPRGEPLGQFGYPGELWAPTGIAATRIGNGDVIAIVDTRACSLSVWRLGD